MTTIGERLKSLRLRMKKTLREQSEVLGVSINSVYRWEHCLAVPRNAVLKKLADYYGVAYEWLKDGKDGEAGSTSSEDNTEPQLLKMYRNLSSLSKYRVLGYVERVYVEDINDTGYPAY